ncbi:hypothetical protein CLV84_1041 [Neolewinella xylanilytica]|uniref:Uncharacterized protein n=1 Tax=Neolewinella xylanilytica TaxID=1514080 RepID=A0A2S6I9B7_9BACT|nr:hypothetical protein [Neolewinella xylanilytica]PPK88078.1 hypothetical protein CLV84_1041 [Neolewinella xylanilytica]
MEIAFSPLLNIYLHHPYFTTGVNPAIEVVPFGPTEGLLRHYQLRWHRRDYGYTLYYGTTGNRTPPLMDPPVSVLLTFLLRSGDPLFSNYTDLPIDDPAASGYYFSSWETVNGELSPAASNRHPVFPPSFLLPDLSPDELTLRDAAGNAHDEGTILGTEDESVRIDLSQSAPGRYILFQAGTPYLTFIGGSHSLPPGAIGLLQCLVSMETHPTAVTDLTLSFAARSTRWRYLVVDSATEESETVTFSIKEASPPAGASAVAFVEAPETRRLANGQEAVELVADTPVALRQRPERQFQLNRSATSGSGTETMTLPLPSAGPSRIIPDPGKETYFSDLFIYL